MSQSTSDVTAPRNLDAELMRALELDLSAIVQAEPMPAGLSGARLYRLPLRLRDVGAASCQASRVVKLVTPAGSWLSTLAEDTALREIQLHASGLLADLPHGIETAVLAYAALGHPRSPTAGALLMRDERARLMPRPQQAPPGRLPSPVLVVLEALARLHARFWEDARLRAREIGVMPLRAALRLLDPMELARFASAGDPSPYLPLALAGWDVFFHLADAGAAARLQSALADPEPYLRAIAALPATLIHGDVWGPNLGWLPSGRAAPRRGRAVLLLDWALAMAGPATFDPLWLCGTWHALHPPRVLAAYRARLEDHLRARGIRLAPVTWAALADAGYLRTALTCGEALGRSAAEAPLGTRRRWAEARVRWWAARAARAAERLLRPSEV
jgi:hypothetical protein